MLKQDSETLHNFMQCDSRELLVRWTNNVLQSTFSKDAPVISNLLTDIRDSSIYAHLLYAISDELFSRSQLDQLLAESDLTTRAEQVIAASKKLNIPFHIFIEPEEITSVSCFL